MYLRTDAMEARAERPPLKLLLGPAGAGKTTWLIERFMQNPNRSLLIVSSAEQAETRVADIAALSDDRNPGIEKRVHAFSSLVNQLVQDSDHRRLGRIGPSLKRMALSDIVEREIAASDFLGSMRGTPGFVPALAERIREWKLACLTPPVLERGGSEASEAVKDPSLKLKSAELARLYRSYERFLEANGLIDDEDCIAIAAQVVRKRGSALAESRFVAVDGMYRFNQRERALLAAFAAATDEQGLSTTEVVVSVPYDPTRLLLFAAPGRTITTLNAEFTVRQTITLRPDAAGRRRAPAAIGARLFSPADSVSAEPASAHDNSSPALGLDVSLNTTLNITLIDAPNAYAEAEIIAREFRRLHDEEAYPWRDLAIILRMPADYSPVLAAVFERYAIPITLDTQAHIADMPPLRAILSLFAIVLGGWQRDAVLAFLKSSFTAPDRVAADSLRRIAVRRGIRAGLSRWIALTSEDGFRGAVCDTVRMMVHFDTLLREQCVRPADFVAAVKQIAEAFERSPGYPESESEYDSRDRAALKQGLDWLEDFSRMAEISGAESVTLDAFHSDMKSAWNTMAVNSDRAAGDRVFVTEPYYARRRPFRVAAIMGLTERMFPRRITEDPFLRDTERAALNAAVGVDLEQQRLRMDDERLFFYLAVTAPTERLILSYPRSSQNADTLPSFYLDEVRALFPQTANSETTGTECGLHLISRTLADVSPRPREIVTAADGLLAACAELADQPGGRAAEGPESDERVSRAIERFEMAAARGMPIADVLTVLRSRRLPTLPRLVDASLRAEFGGGNRVFSVTELEAHRRCPFQYLLRHVLRLRDEQDGATHAAQGSLLHAALCSTFRARRKRGAPSLADPLTQEDRDRDREELANELRAALDQALIDQPLDAGPHRVRMAKRLLDEALTGFAARESLFSHALGFEPAHFELAFGFTDTQIDPREDEDRESDREQSAHRPDYDPASVPEALVLHAGNASVRVCGSIDRVDIHRRKGVALMLDYKLGSSPDHNDMQRGASLQMPLYMLAAERLFGNTAAVGCYDSMREPGRRRVCRSEHVVLKEVQPVQNVDDGRTITLLNKSQYAELMQTAETSAVAAALAIEQGMVDATPGRVCGMCPYGDVCRTTEAGGHDGEPIGSAPGPAA